MTGLSEAHVLGASPPLSDGSFVAFVVEANRAVEWIDAQTVLENLSVWAEAALLIELDHTELNHGLVQQSVLARCFDIRSACLELPVGTANGRWAVAVLEKEVESKWLPRVVVSPVVVASLL